MARTSPCLPPRPQDGPLPTLLGDEDLSASTTTGLGSGTGLGPVLTTLTNSSTNPPVLRPLTDLSDEPTGTQTDNPAAPDIHIDADNPGTRRRRSGRAKGDMRTRVGELQPFIRDKVRQFCQAPLPAHLSQDDLVQEACLSVLTSLPRYSGPPESMQGWVAVIVQRRVAEVYRARKTWRYHPVDDMTSLIDSPDRHDAPDIGLTAENYITTTELLSYLDERSRHLLFLHSMHDLPHDKIARELGSTTAAVRVAYSRALAKLRAMTEWGIGVPVTLIHRNTIRINPRNLDRGLDDLDSLTASIAAHGLRRPLLLHRVPGRGGPVELLDGHRHPAAACRTTRAQVPAVVLTDVSKTWLAQAMHGLPPPEARALLVEHVATGRTGAP